MRSRGAVALACAMGLVAGVLTAGSVAASTTVSHFNDIGPGTQAFWEGGQDSDGNYTVTNFLVFQQLNAPGTQGYFHEVLVIRDGWNQGNLVYEAVYDTAAGSADPTIAITQPLAKAAVRGSAPLASCDGTCPADLPTSITFDETWIAAGPITRSHDTYVDLAPGVRLDMVRGVNFYRAATLAVPDPFGGALGPLGTLSTSDPGVRFFDVHLAFVTVCHPGGC